MSTSKKRKPSTKQSSRKKISGECRKAHQEGVKATRKWLGITHRELAAAAGFQPLSSIAWAGGRNQMSLAAIYAVCKKFNISADFLLGLRKPGT